MAVAEEGGDLVALIDILGLDGYVVVGQDWSGPQGTGAALQRRDRLAALVLMNTWLYTDVCGPLRLAAALDDVARAAGRTGVPQAVPDAVPVRHDRRQHP